MTDRRPSFLVFITDQQRADWLGCMGHPVLRTPHIDAIAASGTRFENFHVASPVCMPNRASLLTGRYPSVHGLRANGCVLSQRASTFVEVLKASGWRTATIGKSHLQPFTGEAPRMAGFETGPIPEAWKPDPGDYGQEEPGRYEADGRYAFRTPYYGFDHVEMVTAHGDRAGGHYRQWFRETVPDWRALHDPANELAHNYGCPQAYRTPVPEEVYPTAWIRDRACAFLSDQAGAEEPFFLVVSFPDPHHPFNPPGRYWDMYGPDQFGVELPYDAHETPPPPLRHLREAFEAGAEAPSAQTARMVSDQSVREAKALTAGMIAMIDDAVGAVTAALKASGRAGETVVAFTSDHGDYLGDFNLLLKGAVPMRGITRVPFLWADPADPAPRLSTALGSTLDISATVLARAGVRPYWGMQGRDLGPVMAGGDGPESLLIEYNDAFPRMGFETPARVRALVTDRWRLTLYAGEGWGELYDLAEDPFETRNLWDDPAHAAIRGELALALADRMTGAMEESPRPERLA